MAERLQKLISAAGLMSRRAAEEAITAGRVTVNGLTAILGQSADPETDQITVDGIPLVKQSQEVYIMLNKPKGYVTTAKDEQGRPTVMELVKDLGIRVYPVGRLDMYSEGLLLLTNDGAMAHRLMHPAHHVYKTYETNVSGTGDIRKSIRVLESPLVIDGYQIKPAQVQLISRTGDKALLSITIGEGRNRQVRKMCAAAGLRVHRLKRVQQGELHLGTLPSGKWRHLTGDEVTYIKELLQD